MQYLKTETNVYKTDVKIEKTRINTGISAFMRVLYEVEVTGLEPAASWSQTKHSTKLSYTSTKLLPYWTAPIL